MRPPCRPVQSAAATHVASWPHDFQAVSVASVPYTSFGDRRYDERPRVFVALCRAPRVAKNAGSAGARCWKTGRRNPERQRDVAELGLQKTCAAGTETEQLLLRW